MNQLIASLAGEQLGAGQTLEVISAICDALQYAHDEGVVHRDIKPEGNMLDES